MSNQKEIIIASLKDNFKLINGFDIENNIIRNTELGSTLNFEPLRNAINIALDCTSKLERVDLSKSTVVKLTKLHTAAKDLVTHFKVIIGYNIQVENPQQRRQVIINAAEKVFESYIEIAHDILILELFESTDDKQKGFNELISKIQIESEKTQKLAQDKVKEIEQILENAKSAAVKVGVSSHNSIFQEEAKFHEDEAKKWLAYTIRMLITTGILAVIFLVMLFCPALQSTNINPIQYAISKVVILAICFIGVSICTKNYKAHKHNSILNKHRQNALSTFETFVKAGSDDQTKNAVLLQTTQSIFSNQNTGYNTSENESDMPSKIIEIVKTTGSKPQ